jgi:hypothetical protein
MRVLNAYMKFTKLLEDPNCANVIFKKYQQVHITMVNVYYFVKMLEPLGVKPNGTEYTNH